MQPVGADPDLGPETKLGAIRETRARIPINRRGIHLAQEAFGGRFIARDNGVAVV